MLNFDLWWGWQTDRVVSCFIFLALDLKSIFHNQIVKQSQEH